MITPASSSVVQTAAGKRTSAEWNNFLRWYCTSGNLYFEDRNAAWQNWQTVRAHVDDEK
jgi:hypothetical protein